MTNDGSTRIGADAIKLTGSKVITMMISMISSMLLSRFRTLTEYGTYSQLLMAINLVCSLIMLGLPNSINYFVAKAQTQEEKDKFLSVYYTLNTILSFVVGLVLVLATPLLETFFKNPLIRNFWYFLAFYPWTKIVMASVEHLLIACRKSNVLMAYRVTNSAVLLGIILLVQLFGGSFSTYLALYLLTEAVFTLWTYWQMLKCTSHFKISMDRNLAKTIFAYSIPIGIASMIGTLNIEIDKLVITSFFSTEELAIYTNASKELPVKVIASTITAVLLPQMVRMIHNDRKNEAIELWKSATTISFSIICFFAAACFAFAPEVITVLYSAKYLDGVSVFRVYCLVLLLHCTYFGMLLNATGKTKFILYSSIGSLFLNVLLNFACYKLFAFIGPAIATLLSTVLMALYQLFYTCKIVDMRFGQIFPWKKCLKLLILNVVLGIVLYLAKISISSIVHINSVLLAILLGFCWAVIFVGVTFKRLKNQWVFLNRAR